MKKIFLIIALIALLFCTAIQISAVTTTNCTDTDNGQNLLVKGTVNYIYNGQNKSATDYCPDSSRLVEYYCVSGSSYGVTKNCVNGCEAGICKSEHSTGLTCSDSDGKNYSNPGYVTFTNTPGGVTNTEEDVCYSASMVKELFCENSMQRYEYATCANGCVSGACRDATTCAPNWTCGNWGACVDGSQIKTCTQSNCPLQLLTKTESQSCSTSSACSDSDNGRDFYIKGTLVDMTGRSSVDFCAGDSVGEYYCDGDSSRFEYKVCEVGCSNGACKAFTCSDTDGGIDYFVKGTVVSLIDQNSTTSVDSCSGNILTEYYCDSAYIKSESKTCDNGCENGRCKFATTCTPSWTCGSWSACSNSSQSRTCTDSNNCGVITNKPAETQSCTVSQTCTDPDGKDYFRKETITYRSVSYTDKCDSRYPNYVLEYYCNSLGEGKAEWGSCANGCNGDGACNPVTNCTPSWTCGNWGTCVNGSQARTCTDSNNCGVTTNKPAETQNCGSCTPNWTCTAWSTCSNSSQARTCTDSNNCGVTTNKPAETQSCIEPGVCYDSDGGEIYSIKGTTTKDDRSSTDSCSGSTLTEYYCSTDGGFRTALATCDYGCENGACKPAVAPTCTDPDGKDYFLKGLTTYRSVPYTDRCDSRYPNYVLEYYCNSLGEGKAEWGSCPNGCNGDGACNPVDTCTPNWMCGPWSNCSNSSQTRTCVQGNCVNQVGTKTENQSCNATGVCSDPDNGINYFTKGTTVGAQGDTYPDVCSTTNELMEYYCSNNTVTFETKTCVCENGACKQNVVCSGKTNGKNYFKEGFITCHGGTFTDTCDSNGYLAEYYYQDNNIYSDFIKCANGCYGRNTCKGSGTFTRPVTADNMTLEKNREYDIGWLSQDYFSFDIAVMLYEVRFVNNKEELFNGRVLGTSYTVAGVTAPERFFHWTGINSISDGWYKLGLSPVGMSEANGSFVYSKSFQIASQQTQTHTECQNGACVNISGTGTNQCTFGNNSACQTSTHTECNTSKQCVTVNGAGTNVCTLGNDSTCGGGNGTCTDTDGGRSYFVYGDVSSHDSINGNRRFYDSCSGGQLTEQYCDGNNSKTETYWCNNGCSSGACIGAVCSETDSGRDYFNAGVTTDANGNRSTDICANGILGEYYCGSDNRTTNYESITCANGCDSYNKACKATVPLCTDSDNGKDYFVKGTTSITGGSSLIDQCVDSTQLKEHYCASSTSTTISTEYKICTNGCEYGLCKPVVSQTCNDPDGKNYNRKETMTYFGLLYTDYCNSQYPRHVVEYYCNNEGVGKAEYGSCGSGTCSYGACVY
jgi:hypothetical protein